MPVVEEMLQLAGVESDDVIYDLGSGDGRIVITAALRYGARGMGFEIDPGLVERSRRAAEQAGVDSLAEFVTGDLFTADLGAATVLTLYLSPELNLRLRPKLVRELVPGARVVSHAFHMGDWVADSVVQVGSGAGRAAVYLWVVPRDLDGFWDMAVETEHGRLGFVLEIEQRHQRLTGFLRREGVEVARLSGTVRGDMVRIEIDPRADESIPAGPLIGRFRGGSLEGTFRSGREGRLYRWRAGPFTLP